MERALVKLLGRELQLYNKQFQVIYTTFFPYMYFAKKIKKIGKSLIFREEIGESVFYYIFDKFNNRIIILRDDQREFENILKKVKGSIIKAIIGKFKLDKFGVEEERDDGLHIRVNDVIIDAELKYKSDIIKPELLPPMPVYYAIEKSDEGKINKDFLVPWKDYLDAIYFAIKFNYTDDLAEKIKMLYESGKSIDDIAKDLKMTYSQVRWMLVKNKVKLRRKSIPDEVKEKVVALAKEGKPAYKIAKELNLNEGTVLRILRKEGLIKRKKKVSKEEIEMIIQLYKEGKSIYQIAKLLGRSTSLVYKYIKQYAFDEEEEERENRNNLVEI